jgi:ubiquinone/menaquinone biosynthesis C-methylase UbiE
MSSNTFLLVRVKRLILDFGCGEGRRWDGTHHDVIGIDINLRRLKIAKHRFPVVNCDGKFLPFRDSMFSSVVSFSVLEHIENHQKALSEITRVLATGGIWRISQPVDNDPIFIIVRRVVKKWQGDAISSHFTTSQLLGQIRAKMRVTNIVYMSNAPLSGVFSFFGRRTPRILQKIDLVYDLACKTTHMFHWQVDIVGSKD